MVTDVKKMSNNNCMPLNDYSIDWEKTDGHCFLHRFWVFLQYRPNSIRNMLVLTVAHNVSFNLSCPRFISPFTFLHLLINLFCDFLKNACFYFFPHTRNVTEQTMLAFDLYLPGFMSFSICRLCLHFELFSVCH